MEKNNILIITGCPRSGTSFLFSLFNNIDKYYYHASNSEPEEISILTKRYIHNKISFELFYNLFIDYFRKQNIKDKIIIFKLPQLSFIIKEIINENIKDLNTDIKVLVTDRNIYDIEKSNLKYHGSIVCAKQNFDNLSLPEDIESSWNSLTDIKDRIKIRIYAYLRSISELKNNKFIIVNYNDNRIYEKEQVIKYLDLSHIQIKQLKENYIKTWTK